MSQAMGQTAPRSLVTLWTPNLERLPICGPCDHSDLIDECPRPVVALLLVLLCQSETSRGRRLLHTWVTGLNLLTSVWSPF